MSGNSERIQNLVRELLVELGEDPAREGLVDTPKRVAASLAYLTSGYQADVEKLINQACFEQETTSMVVVKDIEMYSMCEHHMLPFYGRCHIGYIPRGRVFGISKLARLVDMFARRLQIQERLDRADRLRDQRRDQRRRRGRHDRGAPPLHDDAGRRETEFHVRDLVRPGRLPDEPRDQGGIFLAHQQAEVDMRERQQRTPLAEHAEDAEITQTQRSETEIY